MITNIILTLSLFSFMALTPYIENSTAKSTGGGGESGYAKVRDGEDYEKKGKNFETGKVSDAYKRPSNATDTQAKETTSTQVEEALTKDGDYSVPLKENEPDFSTKLDVLGTQADLDMQKKIFKPILENDADMKKEDKTKIYNDRKGSSKTNQTDMVSNKDYNAQFRDPYGSPREDKKGDINYRIDGDAEEGGIDGNQAGAKAVKQIPKYTDPNSNKLDPATDPALTGDPLQQ